MKKWGVKMATSEKELRTCDKGHKYYKSSDCLTCPTCEQEKNLKVDFSRCSQRRQEEH